MRKFWAFFAGMFFGGAVLLWTAPLVVVAVALAVMLGRTDLFSAFSGESVFGVRDQGGRLQGRLVNTTFQTIQVAAADGQRPRRLVVRLDVRDADVFSDHGRGQVRLDAWPVEAARDLMAPPLYTIQADGRSASVGDDGMLTVQHGQRVSAFALADGRWLADSDGPFLTLTVEGERKRLVAVAAAADDDPPGAIAVITYASPQAVMQRFLLGADDTARAVGLRSALAPARLSPRAGDGAHHILDVVSPAGMVHVPLAGDRLDGGQASLPAGMTLTEVKPWR